MNPKIINRQGPIDNPYIAGFQDETIGLYAKSLGEAKQRALEYFRPKKRDKNLMWVEKAFEDEDE